MKCGINFCHKHHRHTQGRDKSPDKFNKYIWKQTISLLKDFFIVTHF